MKVNQLEKTANAINLNLRRDRKALILKIPVPIVYTQRGLIAQTSTVDYAGLIGGGKFIAYDAKETEIKTRFPLANIHQHQLLYLEMVKELGGIAFFLIHFKKIHPTKVYITPLSIITKYWYDDEGRRSIPFKDFKNEWLTEPEHYLTKVKKLCSQKIV
jgi:recombination protein U